MANWLGVIQTATLQASKETEASKKEEFFSRVILPFVYIFIFFNIKTDRTRLSNCLSYIFFYTVVAAENTILIIIFWKNQEGDELHWFPRAAVFAQAAFLIIGIALQGIYYAFLEHEPDDENTQDD